MIRMTRHSERSEESLLRFSWRRGITINCDNPQFTERARTILDRGANPADSALAAFLPTEYKVRDLCIRPAAILAPMAGVTDTLFRRVIRGLGGRRLTIAVFTPPTQPA